VAANVGAPATVLAGLAKDASQQARAEVARNAWTPSFALTVLAADINVDVQIAVARVSDR